MEQSSVTENSEIAHYSYAGLAKDYYDFCKAVRPDFCENKNAVENLTVEQNKLKQVANTVSLVTGGMIVAICALVISDVEIPKAICGGLVGIAGIELGAVAYSWCQYSKTKRQLNAQFSKK